MSMKRNEKTCSKSMEVKKQIIQMRAKFEADIKAKLKAAGLIVFDETKWNQPSEYVFKWNTDLKKYLADRKMSLDRFTIRGIADDPTIFGFATAEELTEFKNVTWPKLETEYAAKRAAIRKAKRAENAKDIGKLKARLAKLQAQINELEG